MKGMIMENDKAIGIELSFSAREDGMLEAAYIQFAHGKVFETRELQGNMVLGDYDSHGTLLGIEILKPIKLSDIKRFIPPNDLARFENVCHQRVSDLVGCD